jgi:type IV fimbrial biogenesis protein FimT
LHHWAAGGFTLVELMVVITVFAILLAIALPSFNTLIMNNRLATVSSEVQGTLALARAEAVTRRQPVAVCPSADAGATTDPPVCASTWASAGQGGLVVFADTGDTPGTPAAGKTLRRIQFGNAALKVTASNLISCDGKPCVRFAPSGQAQAGGYLKFCDTRTENVGRELRIFPAGRVEAIRLQPCP